MASHEPWPEPYGLHFGHLILDQALHLTAWPTPGTEVQVRERHLAVGGSETNTAIVVARFGYPVRLITRVGTDLAASWLRERLATVPRLTVAAQVDPQRPTGTVTLLVGPDGERALLTARGACDALQAPRLSRAPRYVYVTTYTARPPAVARAAQRLIAWAGAEPASQALFIDINADFTPAQRAVVARWLAAWPASKVRVLIANLEAARAFVAQPQAPPDAVLQALRAHADVAVLKMGAQGAWLATAERAHFVPPVPVQPRDTTGAGDAFNAGLLIGWAAGWDWPLAGHVAGLLGALATTVPAAGLALPGPEAAFAYLDAHPNAWPAPWPARVRAAMAGLPAR